MASTGTLTWFLDNVKPSWLLVNVKPWNFPQLPDDVTLCDLLFFNVVSASIYLYDHTVNNYMQLVVEFFDVFNLNFANS